MMQDAGLSKGIVVSVSALRVRSGVHVVVDQAHSEVWARTGYGTPSPRPAGLPLALPHQALGIAVAVSREGRARDRKGRGGFAGIGAEGLCGDVCADKHGGTIRNSLTGAGYPWGVAEWPDLDERFTLHPLEGEEALRALVADDPEPEDDGPEDGPATTASCNGHGRC
jgi:hypothetical protein